MGRKRPAIKTPRSPHAVRREHTRQRLTAAWKGKTCVACDQPATQEHHIIQIQHGGTNRPMNKVWVCNGCHQQIHPFMKLVPTNLPVGSVPYMKDTEQTTKCPACGFTVLSVRPLLKRGRAVHDSTRPILLHADAVAPYTTKDLHQQDCFNKRGLSRLRQQDLAQLAREDGKAKHTAADEWNTQNVARAIQVMR